MSVGPFFVPQANCKHLRFALVGDGDIRAQRLVQTYSRGLTSKVALMVFVGPDWVLFVCVSNLPVNNLPRLSQIAVLWIISH